jgi:hypothetical protein
MTVRQFCEAALSRVDLNQRPCKDALLTAEPANVAPSRG